MPINITTQELLRSRIGQNATGLPMAAGFNIDQNAAGAVGRNIYTVPVGQVLLITHIVCQVDRYSTIGGPANSETLTVPILSPDPARFYANLSIGDPSETFWLVGFRGMVRWNNTFHTGGSPHWQNAPAGNVHVWKLKYPIPVPQKWSVSGFSTTASIDFGNPIGIYGVAVDENDARTMGFGVEDATPTSSRSFGIAFSQGDDSVADLIPAVTGKSIRILDMSVQVQPQTNTLEEVILTQTDGRQVFRFVNSNPANFLDLKFSPDIYLASGQALQIVTTSASTAPASATCITYEYVDADDVPSDHWWASTDPELPTPAGANSGFMTTRSTGLTMYYPRRDSEETTQEKGYQHVLSGYCFSLQKDALASTADADTTERTKFGLSTGSAAGEIEMSFAGIASEQSNYQMGPIFGGSGHDQTVFGVVDDIFVPAEKDDGRIWIDAAGLGNGTLAPATPTQTDNDVIGFWVTCWGRTLPSTFTDRTNPGA